MCCCRSGSVNVNMTLVFTSKNAVPSASNATSLLRSELSNSTLNIIPGSISACESKKSYNFDRSVLPPGVTELIFFPISYFRFNVNFKHGDSACSRNSCSVFTNAGGSDIDSDRLLGLVCTELAHDLMGHVTGCQEYRVW